MYRRRLGLFRTRVPVLSGEMMAPAFDRRQSASSSLTNAFIHTSAFTFGNVEHMIDTSGCNNHEQMERQRNQRCLRMATLS